MMELWATFIVLGHLASSYAFRQGVGALVDPFGQTKRIGDKNNNKKRCKEDNKGKVTDCFLCQSRQLGNKRKEKTSGRAIHHAGVSMIAGMAFIVLFCSLLISPSLHRLPRSARCIRSTSLTGHDTITFPIQHSPFPI